MNELLNAASKPLCDWLAAKLPLLGSDWWKENVVNRLVFQQQRFAEERHISTLSNLDPAALLRVLDQNWHELGAIISLPREARNWVKELQAVRNRWAHTPSGGIR